ncbi:uncharacterized protein TNCV_2475011 [Trichonephila clavipes]|nr:uncharacterized protein TNCV_2475011 [Trichonephila clavipes]
MAQHRPRKPASVEYTTDEKDMIVYDVEEDESASNSDYVQKDGKTYFRGSLLLSPTRSRNLTENSLAVLNHKILEANSQVQNVKLGGHQTCLSINRLWHELCDMLRRLVGTTAPGHHDCSIQE